jgi:hypothetical protein
MLINIIVELEEDDDYADPSHSMGITNEAYERLTGLDPEHPEPLEWLGSVTDVKRVE